MIRHVEYTRARLAQASERLRSLIYAATRPFDELLVAGPVERISLEEAAPQRAEPFSQLRRAVVPYLPHQLLTMKAL